MTTTRDFVDSHLRCPLDGKLLEIRPETDPNGMPIHACLNCDYQEVETPTGVVAEQGVSQPWFTAPCDPCGAAVIWCNTLSGRRMPLDARPSRTGIFSLHVIAGRDPQAQYDYGHPTRRLYSSHLRTCTARQGVAS